jgi:predicted Rossmann fold nucleotide-binding protein DprA/Smf involved in DNA uptake
LTELNLIDNLAKTEAREIVPDSPDEEILLKLLKKPRLVDELIKESGLASGAVNSALVMMEIKGMITNLGGTRYEIEGKLKEN